MVCSEVRLVHAGRKKARVFKIRKELERDKTLKSPRDECQVGNWSDVLAGGSSFINMTSTLRKGALFSSSL